MIILIVCLIIAAVVGYWWFYIREQDFSSKQAIELVGKLYGDSNLTVLYEFGPSSSVRILNTETLDCVFKKWELKSPDLVEIIDVASFKITDKLTRTSDGTVFELLEGSISRYCDLLGKNVTV